MSDQQYIINHADYIGSYTKWSEPGYGAFPEFAFIGRSNVGKSSLINYLMGRKKLAHTSSSPGKTKAINLFVIEKKWNLVDLPGYGYAKSSKKDRKIWGQMIEEYLRQRKNLVNVFQLIDANIPPQKIDVEFTNWLGENQIPFTLIFTKTDKGKKLQIEKNIESYLDELRPFWAELPPFFTSSATKNTGKKEIMDYIFSIYNGVKGRIG